MWTGHGGVPFREILQKYVMCRNDTQPKNDNTIIRPNIPSLKGETVRRKPNPVVSNYVNNPKKILQLHKNWSIAKCPLRSHSLVCIKNDLIIVEIGPILNIEIDFFPSLIVLIVRAFISLWLFWKVRGSTSWLFQANWNILLLPNLKRTYDQINNIDK